MDEDIPNPFDDDVKPAVSPAPATSARKDDEVAPLNAEQIDFVDKNWKAMDLMEMTRHIYKNDNLKGTSKEGRQVRQYLISKGYEYKTIKDSRIKEEVVLSEENKEFIVKYATTMKPYEIARVIFSQPTLHQFSKEALAVQLHIKAVSPTVLKNEDEYTDQNYIPPKTFKNCYKKIQEVTSIKVEEDKLNVKMKKCVERTMDFLNAPRFSLTVNNLKNIGERSIFESEYIRAVWDKPDLTADEVNLYISLVGEYVIQDRLNRIQGKLNMMLENITADPEGKIAMGLTEAMKNKADEYHRSLTRQADYTKDLSGKRADRQKNQIARMKSLVSLVEAFRDENERKAALRFANMRKKAVEDEMTRLESKEEWEARIFGITKEEILE